MATMKRKLHFAWVVLLGICIIMGLSRGGINNIGGLFMTPVMTELGCGAGEFMLYFSTSSLVTILFLPKAGRLMKRYDVRILLVIGLILQAGSFAVLSYMHSIWGWYILSLPMAVGSVFTTQIVGPVLIGNWFKKCNGLAVGIMMATVGLFGAILQPLTGILITNLGWRQAYMILGIAVMVVGIPVVLLTIRKHPSDKGLFPLGDKEMPNYIGTAEKAPQGITLAEAKRTLAFWALIMFMVFTTAVACFSQHLPQYANQLGYDTIFAGKAMGFYMAGTSMGAIILGLLADIIEVKNATSIALLCGLAAALILIFEGQNPMLFCTAAILYGFSSATVGTLGPLLTISLFGEIEYGAIYAFAAMGTALAGMMAPSGFGYIYDIVQSYAPALWVNVVMLGLCVISIMVAFHKKLCVDEIME